MISAISFYASVLPRRPANGNTLRPPLVAGEIAAAHEERLATRALDTLSPLITRFCRVAHTRLMVEGFSSAEITAFDATLSPAIADAVSDELSRVFSGERF